MLLPLSTAPLGSVFVVSFSFWNSVTFSYYFWLNTIFGRNITLLSSSLGKMNLSHLTETIKSMPPKVLQWQWHMCKCQPKNPTHLLLTDPSKWRSYTELSKGLSSEKQMRDEPTHSGSCDICNIHIVPISIQPNKIHFRQSWMSRSMWS